MKIIVDAFGGDSAPLSVIQGASDAVREYGARIILTGDEKIIKKCASDNGISLDGIEIVHTPDVMSMHDSPHEIMKSKNNSSMAVGLKLLNEGKGDAFVSAGSTGALVIGASMIVKRIRGIKRAALATVLPSSKGCFMLIDCGANAECRPEMLQHFGIMGSVYMNKVLDVEKPKVGLVNIGTEPEKGGTLQLDAYKLLSSSPIEFYGNIEARDIPEGICDVVVCDGFTGNVVLKLMEGVAGWFVGMIKEIFLKNAKSKLAYLLIRPGMKMLKKKMSYSEYGGAPLMGISKPVFKSHGSSDANSIKKTINQAMKFSQNNVIGIITESLQTIKDMEEDNA